MATVRSYRLISLSALVVGVLMLFMGFFFLWVVAPAAVIGLFYLVFVFLEDRRALKNGAFTRRAQRRQRLTSESVARERDVERLPST